MNNVQAMPPSGCALSSEHNQGAHPCKAGSDKQDLLGKLFQVIVIFAWMSQACESFSLSP